MRRSLALIALFLAPGCPRPAAQPEQPSATREFPGKPILLDYDAETPLPRARSDRYTVPFFAGAKYDSAITAPDKCLGHAIGDGLATAEAIVGCFRRWAEESPRARLERYALSHEGRELVRVVVTSPKNLARLDAIKADTARLADPRGLSGAAAAELIGRLPATALFGYSIHGDEVSGADASVAFGYHLIAGSEPAVTALLDQVVVLVDPVMNPDGRTRTVTQVQQSASQVANLNHSSMHRGRWPWGRGNHYLFDMNRDWIIGAAPETRGRWQNILEYNPQLVIDAHEMWAQDTYLFYPISEPINPYLSPALTKWHKAFAADHSGAFNRYGWAYYTREWADGWYPGYSDAWASLSGAIGILYEQASTKGQPLLRAAGDVVTYRETVHAQAVSSLANLTTLARNRTAVLRDFLAYKRSQIAQARRVFVVAPGLAPDREAALIAILMRQGIEVYRARKSFTARNALSSLGRRQTVTLPEGTYLVPAAQPRGALVRSLLDFDVRFAGDFLRVEREELEKRARSKIYDITAWNLGHAFALDAYWIDRLTVASDRVTALPELAKGVVQAGKVSAYAWVVDGRLDASIAFAAHAVERGLAVRVADEAFSAAGREMPPGSVLIRFGENPKNTAEIVDRVARATGVQVFAVTTGRSTTDGPDLGGQHFHLLHRPRIAVLSNSPVWPSSFGHVWHLLDRELKVPLTMVDGQFLGGYDLRRYNVLILPVAGPLLRAVIKGQAKQLAQWIDSGGTLIAMGSTAAMIASEELGLSKVRLRRDVLTDLAAYRVAADRDLAARAISVDEKLVWDGPPDSPAQGKPEEPGKAAGPGAGPGPGGGKSPIPPALKEKEAWMMRFRPRGVMLRGLTAQTEWLAFGTRDEMPVFMTGDHVLLARPPVRVPVRVAPAKQLRLSGLLWPEARERLEKSAYVTVESIGAGQIILFASPPAFRALTRGTARLLSNAAIYGPSLGARQPLRW